MVIRTICLTIVNTYILFSKIKDLTLCSITRRCYLYTFAKDIFEKSSLKHYRFIKQGTSKADYLNSKAPFRAIQLKCKIRLGISSLGEELFRQKGGNGLCPCGTFETVKHFIMECPIYKNCRMKLFSDISKSYDETIVGMLYANQDFPVSSVLGDHDDDFNKHFLKFVIKA